jgi:hypothetical protein
LFCFLRFQEKNIYGAKESGTRREFGQIKRSFNFAMMSVGDRFVCYILKRLVPVELQQFAYKELITFFKNVHLGPVGAEVPVTTQFAKLCVEFSMTIAANLNEMNGNPLKMRTFFQHCVLNEDGYLLRIPSSKFINYLETIVIPK